MSHLRAAGSAASAIRVVLATLSASVLGLKAAKAAATAKARVAEKPTMGRIQPGRFAGAKLLDVGAPLAQQGDQAAPIAS